MRRTAFFAALASVAIAGAGLAGTPAVIEMEQDDRMTPIAAVLPPLSDRELGLRCHGFFRAMQVRHQLAQMMGFAQLELFSFLAELPIARLDRVADAGGDTDYVTPYMVEFGPLDPLRTARSGLFASDRRTCTDFLDRLG